VLYRTRFGAISLPLWAGHHPVHAGPLRKCYLAVSPYSHMVSLP
jgi:hypothetical protein